ncbi:unnamed protein product, partial [Iphiclides podalirius]
MTKRNFSFGNLAAARQRGSAAGKSADDKSAKIKSGFGVQFSAARLITSERSPNSHSGQAVGGGVAGEGRGGGGDNLSAFSRFLMEYSVAGDFGRVI